MIGALKGKIAALGEDVLLMDVQGVHYVVEAGSRTLGRLQLAQETLLWVDTKVSQDAIRLFGFLSDEERAWFERLQTIPGVGPRAALSVLDVLAPAALMDAVSLEDKASVARAHGVGQKLALRIVQELKGKAPPRGFLGGFAPSSPSDSPTPSSDPFAAHRKDALSALVNLGYPALDAQRAIARILRDATADLDLSTLVRRALKDLTA